MTDRTFSTSHAGTLVHHTEHKEHLVSITVEAKSSEDALDAQFRLAKKLEGIAAALFKDVDRSRNVMAP